MTTGAQRRSVRGRRVGRSRFRNKNLQSNPRGILARHERSEVGGANAAQLRSVATIIFYGFGDGQSDPSPDQQNKK